MQSKRNCRLLHGRLHHVYSPKDGTTPITTILKNISLFFALCQSVVVVFGVVQMRQELWAIDLGISYSDSLAMFNLFEFATRGKLDPMTHYFEVPPPKKEEKKVRRRKCVNALQYHQNNRTSCAILLFLL